MSVSKVPQAFSTPIVKMHQVFKKFGTNDVLRGVSFEAQKGQILAIIGASGSGKSTALRCINRLEHIDSGYVEVCGQRIDHPHVDLQKLRRQVGIVFQGYNLFPHLNVIDNITLALKYVKHMSRKDASLLASSALEKVGLLEKQWHFPSQLSGGQQQRVAIARSLAMEPSVMLFDEVTSALDPKLTLEVLKVIEGLAKTGMTMLLVTHEMTFAKRIADLVLFMHHGRIWETGSSLILDKPQTPELKTFLSNGL